MSKIISTVASVVACVEAAAIRAPENGPVAVQNGAVMSNATLNALDNKARIEEAKTKGTLVHWYAPCLQHRRVHPNHTIHPTEVLAVHREKA